MAISPPATTDTRSDHGADGFHQETVHRHHPVDRGRRRHAGLALPDGRTWKSRTARSLTVRESQVAVFVNEGKVADVFGPGMYKLTTQTLPVLTYLKNWDKLFESPVQERRLLLQHAPADRPALGHAAADHDPRQGLRRGAPARLRQLQLPHRRRQAVPHRDLRHARRLHRGRPRRPAARPDAAEHQRRHRRQRRALPRPGGQPGRVRAGAARRSWRPTFAKLGLQARER